MHLVYRIIYGTIFFLSYHSLYALDFGSSLSSFTSSMKGVGSAMKQFGEGMAESFGMNPPGYNYSFRFANNASGKGECEARRIKKFQGMMIKRGQISSHTLAQGEISDASAFNNIGLYLEVVLRSGGKELYTNNIVDLLPSYKQNTETYFYNIYENEDGPAAEHLGAGKTTSSKFLATIFNKTQEIQSMTFPYGNQEVTLQLDPNSCNTLMSPQAAETTIKYPIRPATDVAVIDCGAAGKVPVLPEGLASGSKGSGGKWTNIQPLNYHYEIVEDTSTKKSKLITRGFNPGHFSQETNGRIRNIVPVECLVWNKSSSQMDAAQSGYSYLEFNNRSVWVAYSFTNFSIKNKKDGTVIYDGQEPIMVKVPAGQAVQFFFMRPSVDFQSTLTDQELLQVNNLQPTKTFHELDTETLLGKPASHFITDLYSDIKATAPETVKASLYILSLSTNDEQKAKTFLKNLIGGKIPIPKGPSIVNPNLTQEQEGMLLTGKLPVDLGQLKDSDSGVNGYLLCYDVFTPYASGGPGPYYYTVKPPQAFLSLTQMTLTPYLDPAFSQKKGASTEIQTQVEAWAQELWGEETKEAGIAKVRKSVANYLQQNGQDGLFGTTKGKLDKTKFSWMWNMGLNMVITGPKGLVNIPLQWAAGTNHYPYSFSAKPTKINSQTNQKESDWNPNQVIGLDGKPVVEDDSAPSVTSTPTTTS